MTCIGFLPYQRQSRSSIWRTQKVGLRWSWQTEEKFTVALAGNAEMGRWGDAEIGRWGNAGVGRCGDAGMGRWGDAGKGGWGDAGMGDAVTRDGERRRRGRIACNF